MFNFSILASLETPFFFIFLLHLGQRLKAPPAAVAAGIARVKVIPAAVGRAAVPVRAARAVSALAVEVAGIRPRVAGSHRTRRPDRRHRPP